jgi:hypothetical protein
MMMNAIHASRIRIEVLLATLLVACLVGCVPSAPASNGNNVEQQSSQAAAPRPADPVRVLVAQGTELDVTLSTAIGSETSQVGDSVTATTTSAVMVGNQVAVPMGSTLHGRVTDVEAGTKGLKISEKGGVVVLSFDTVTTPQGSTTPIFASITKIASSTGKTAGIIGGSAAGGALLGKILGGDTKDAAVGAVLGGAIGTGIAAGTKGKELKIPAGTELTMVLDQALSIVQS